MRVLTSMGLKATRGEAETRGLRVLIRVHHVTSLLNLLIIKYSRRRDSDACIC